MATGIVTYRKNPRYLEREPDGQPRLYAQLDLTRMGVQSKVKSLPIYYERLTKPLGAIRVIYKAQVAGLPFEAGNLQRLEQVIVDALKILVRFQSLPAYVFQVGENAYPIYDLENELLTRYPGGPVFSAPSIRELRVWLADHFKELGRIKNRREMDLLYFSAYDLQLYDPYCVIRTPDENTPDIPVFQAPQDDMIHLLAPMDRDEVSLPYNHICIVFELQTLIGESLVQDGYISDPTETTIRKMSLAVWNLVTDCLELTDQKLTYTRQREDGLQHNELPVYRYNQKLVAARANRMERVVVYSGDSIEELKERAAKDLSFYGAIESEGAVQVL